jgi:ABC-type nitrate/sulfonate/bicarbonate transport system permease component
MTNSVPKHLSKVIPYFVAAMTIIAVWQTVITTIGPHPSVLPPPLIAGKTFAELIVSGEIFHHAGISIRRVLSAWLIACTIAIPLGLVMGRYRLFERIVDPFVELFRPISALAWIPLAILWFGIGELGKIFVIFIATFFPTVLNTVAGVKEVDPVLIRAGQVLGCKNEPSIFRRIILPAALPSIVVGVRISFGTGWTAIIAAELVAARSGLGYLIAEGMEVLRPDLVLVGMSVIAALGVLFDSVFRLIYRRGVGW